MVNEKNANKNNNNIQINLRDSSISEFTKRRVPSTEEVEEFEDYVEEEAKDEEIEESLNEIYHDEKGQMVDVKKMENVKRRGVLYWLFTFIIVGGILGGGGYAAYNYFYINAGSDATAVKLSIEGKQDVVAGEEFYYTINYQNENSVAITNIFINVKFPDEFVYLDSDPQPSHANNRWQIERLDPHSTKKIKIKGMMVGSEGDNGYIHATIDYTPENFSSEFKKEATLTTAIKDIGMYVDVETIKSALIGETHDISIHLQANDNNFINSFRVVMEPQEFFEFINFDGNNVENAIAFSIDRPGVWQVNNLEEEEKILPIKIKFLDKPPEGATIHLEIQKKIAEDEGKYLAFYKKDLSFEVMKSDLNLSLIINGSRDDKGVDFGQTLNYSIVYNNKGETAMKDVLIMAVLKSDLLDWTSLKDPNKGEEKGNVITWSKLEIPELESLEVDEEGTIDFSINTKDIASIDPKADNSIISYARYSVGASKDDLGNISDDNKSNTITNKMNSDLRLTESVRYFNSDNIPVGTGPHPPKVGKETSYKVYWDLRNDLHELKDLEVNVRLPDYVTFSGKSRTTVGNIQYNESNHEVTWRIGRLPVTVFLASAEFSIAVTPVEEDRNKIMVLMPGTNVQATDVETKAALAQVTPAKTTKLPDDDIAVGDGIVE